MIWSGSLNGSEIFNIFAQKPSAMIPCYLVGSNKNDEGAVVDRNRLKVFGGKHTGLAGVFVGSFERRFFPIVILPVFEAPFGFFFRFRGAGMFGKRMGKNMDSFLFRK